MLLGNGNVPEQALIRLGVEEDVGFLTPRPFEQGWDATNLTILLDKTHPDAMINLAFYHDWLQAEQVETERLGAQERAVERLAELCQHYEIPLVQPSSCQILDGARAIAYSEKDETLPLGLRGRVFQHAKQSVCVAYPQHVLVRFGWPLDESLNGLLGRFPSRVEQPQPLLLADDRRDNPAPVDDVAWVVFSALKQLDCRVSLWGTYHYGGLGITTILASRQVTLNGARIYRSNLTWEPPTEVHAARSDALNGPWHTVVVCKKTLYIFDVKPCVWCVGLSVLLDGYYRHI